MPQRSAQAGREGTGANIMTPRARRTDPIYNVCVKCGQSGHCSASCTRGVRLNDGFGVLPEPRL